MDNKSIMHTEHQTIMMLDLCSYTKISSKINRHTLNKLHDAFDILSIPTIQEHHGIVIKKIGDAFLATFKSPTNAVHCAIALQNKFMNYNRRNKPKFPLNIKIAMHTGEVLLKNKDIYGDAVNITARIESAARTNQILFSSSLFNAMNKNEISCRYLGRKRFKGVKYPVKIYMVKPRLLIKPRGFSARKIIAGILIILAVCLVLRYFF